MKKILIVGATSAIAEACMRLWAQEGDRLFLVGRREDRLIQIANDLRIRGANKVGVFVMDATDVATHSKMLQKADAELEGLDHVLIAHGTLPDQQACADDPALALKEINTNALSIVSLLTLVANKFEAQRKGVIAVISSVAGDRGRQSNYVYGSAKALVSTFLSGLRQRLAKVGVRVLTIKPGFVDTPMTASFKKGLLWAKPDQVAASIVKAMEKKNGEIYTPIFWRGIMMVIKSVPGPIFNKMKL